MWTGDRYRHGLSARGIKNAQNISYVKLKKYYPRINPTTDLDKDGIPNALDKKPLKISKQDQLLLEKWQDVDNVAINLIGDAYLTLDNNQKGMVDALMEIGQFYRFMILRGTPKKQAIYKTLSTWDISKKEWNTMTDLIGCDRCKVIQNETKRMAKREPKTRIGE